MGGDSAPRLYVWRHGVPVCVEAWCACMCGRVVRLYVWRSGQALPAAATARHLSRLPSLPPPPPPQHDVLALAEKLRSERSLDNFDVLCRHITTIAKSTTIQA
eukprot:349667-Chlamydomonas_euryale.AAC.8